MWKFENVVAYSEAIVVFSLLPILDLFYKFNLKRKASLSALLGQMHRIVDVNVMVVTNLSLYWRGIWVSQA